MNEKPTPPNEQPLPKGYPERPDGKKVNKLRNQLKSTREARKKAENKAPGARYTAKFGKQAKDIGTYTLIPMMMLAGPIVGYGLGWILEKQWGGAPWTGVIGLLLGVLAAFRQIFIILAKKARADKSKKSN